VLSTWNDGNYAVESGTSMAAPHVAAAAALVLAADPALSGPQVATLLRQTASPLGPGSSPVDGGFLNVGAAVRAAASHRLPSTLDGYQLIGSNGSVYNSGVDSAQGSLVGDRLAKPVVGGAERSDGLGYWLVASDGGVFAFGDAHFFGSTGKSHLNKPIVAMAATPDGLGYWLVASDGGVFTFGDAHFYGSETPGKAAPTIVGIAPCPYGEGYWLAGSKGQVYGFGSARYEVSSSTKAPSAPIVAISA
jgi:hypothetical protein